MNRRGIRPLTLAALYGALCLLVLSGLTWVTLESLRLEDDRRRAGARADQAQMERLALWHLDSRLFPAMGVENNRLYAHYFPLHTPLSWVCTTDNKANMTEAGLLPSPLLMAELPTWMKLHVQLDPDTGWESPQVMSGEIETRFNDQLVDLYNTPLNNLNGARSQALADLREQFQFKPIHEQLLKLEFINPDDSPLGVPYLIDPPNVKAPPVPVPQAAMLDNMNSGKTIEVAKGDESLAKSLKLEEAKPGEAAPAASGIPMKGAEAGPPAPKSRPIPPPTAPAQPVPSPSQVVGGRGGNTKTPAQPGTGGINDRTQSSGRGFDEVRPKYEAGNAANVMPTPPAAGPSLIERNNDAKSAKEKENTVEAKKAEEPTRKQDATDQGAGAKDAAGASEPAKRAMPVPDLKADAAQKQNAVPVPPNDKRTAKGTMRPPAVHLGPMRPVWITGAKGQASLLFIRAAKLESKIVFQGVLLDWAKLQGVLLDEIRPQLPEARLLPLYDAVESDRRMIALPAMLDPGPQPEPPPAGATPLRIGLSLGWLAALLALGATGFVGWTLIDLSERRIRFVSAVTHELRTPLTSLRLYLDLLTSGMIRDEDQQRDYLNTLNKESERLNRLIDNVLDFAKLEKRSVQAQCTLLPLSELLHPVEQAWAERLASEGRELVVESGLPPDTCIHTDARIAAQVLCNLLDNARKYAAGADDTRIWLRAGPGGAKSIYVEVEDRGPGVAPTERAGIFKPFRRGESADTTAGGAGLGLALARQWAEMLRGNLTYRAASGGVGACFRLELPRC